MTAGALLTVERLADVAVLTMNDPSTLNAMSFAMAEELTAALDQSVEDGARCLLLTGAGRGFCSGANLSLDVNVSAPDYDAGASLDRYYHPLVRTIRDLPVPIVTAVNGAAAGLGCAVALLGDLVVASETAYLLQAFCHVALVPDGGSAALITKAAGRARAMEMMLLGERVPAQRALEWGLVNRVVPHDLLMASSLDLAARLASGPTGALGAIRAQCWAAAQIGFDDMLALERRQQRAAGQTADHREGVTAFLEKRPANFVGVQRGVVTRSP